MKIKDFLIKNQLALITLLVASIACFIVYKIENNKKELFNNSDKDNLDIEENDLESEENDLDLELELELEDNNLESEDNDLESADTPLTLKKFNKNMNNFILIFSTKPFIDVFMKIINSDYTYNNPIKTDEELNTIIKKDNELLINYANKAKSKILILLNDLKKANNIFTQDEIKMANVYLSNHLNNVNIVLDKLVNI